MGLVKKKEIDLSIRTFELSLSHLYESIYKIALPSLQDTKGVPLSFKRFYIIQLTLASLCIHPIQLKISNV